MRNLILLLLLPVFAISQQVYVDSIQVTGITGTDSSFFIQFRSEKGSSVEFDFTNFDANDATLDFGYSNTNTGFASVSGAPYMLDSATYSKTVNGVTSRKMVIRSDKWSGKWVGFKLTKTSVSSGTLIWRWVR